MLKSTMHTEKYPGYKDSGVEWLGEIPEHWEIRRIKYLYYIGRGRVIAQTELNDNGIYPVYSSQTKDNGILGYIETYDFDCKQITWTTDGANAGTVFLREGKHNCTNVCGTLQTKSKDQHIEFIAYALQVSAQFYKRPDTNGAKIMNGEMAEIFVTLPPLTEQTAIANFLDDKTAMIDKAIAQKEKLIELLGERKQILIQNAVTRGLDPNVKLKDSGVDWIGEIPVYWEVGRVKQCSRVISKGTTPSTEGREILENGPVRFLKAENINDGNITNSPLCFIDKDTDRVLKRSKLFDGDILFVIAGATLGKVAIVDRTILPANTNQAVAFIRPNSRIVSQYLSLWLSSNSIKEIIWLKAVQSAQPNLAMGDLGNFPISIPPLHEQKTIVSHIKTQSAKIDKAIDLQKQQIEKLKEYKATLINSAVTGKIKVNGYGQ